MNTVKNLLLSGLQILLPHSSSARLDTECLLAFVLEKPRSFLYGYPETSLTEEQYKTFQALLHKREAGIPISYLTGQREFWSLNLKVTPDTLIPRPETEMLVELTLKALKNKSKAHILDLGTGSGAISLALAKERPDWEIHAADKSEAALNIAKENAKNLGLKIQFYHSDWFSTLLNQKYHAIVSNPPYIEKEDPHLLQGDLRFEPQQALVSEEMGLKDIRILIENAPNHLYESGFLLLEHGFNQKNKIASILKNAGFKEIHCYQDYQGLDRISQGIWYS